MSITVIFHNVFGSRSEIRTLRTLSLSQVCMPVPSIGLIKVYCLTYLSSWWPRRESNPRTQVESLMSLCQFGLRGHGSASENRTQRTMLPKHSRHLAWYALFIHLHQDRLESIRQVPGKVRRLFHIRNHLDNHNRDRRNYIRRSYQSSLLNR